MFSLSASSKQFVGYYGQASVLFLRAEASEETTRLLSRLLLWTSRKTKAKISVRELKWTLMPVLEPRKLEVQF
eukprot:2756337-Amphidinium_carterae.1